MDRVVTIHGIWTTGQWQENVAPVLWPHFEPVSVKYPYYRWLGPLDLVFEPLILLPGIACLIFLYEIGRIHDWPIVSALWASLFLVSYGVTYFRRQKVVDRFVEETSHTTLAGRAPHIIAHSFGTYLTTRALRESPFTRGDRIVLTGCVLSRGFNWEAFLRSKENVFQAIRNDVGRKDFPVLLAGWIQHLIKDFGSAGRHGFCANANGTHDVAACGTVCESCANGSTAIVHNVFNDYGGHSTAFLGTNYAANYWLPFFWGFDPKDYDDFLKLCWAITNYQALKPKLLQPGAHPSEPGALFEAALYEREWHWAEGTFTGRVETEILKAHPEYEQKPELLEELVLSATLGVCQAVADAMDAQGVKLSRKRKSKAERADYKSPEDGRIVALNPLQAVKRALEELYAQEGKTR